MFSYPLPSISNLWPGGQPSNGLGRTSGKRLEAGHPSHVPYEEGFVPSVGPVRPPWAASASNSTFKFQQKEFHKQDHKLRFPPPTVNSNGPFDHRGSLPIRDDPLTTTSPAAPANANPTQATKPVLTQKGVLPLVFAEQEEAPQKVVQQTSASPARTNPSKTTTESSTTPDFSKLFPQDDDYQSGPSGSEYPSNGGNNYTYSSKFNNDNTTTLGNQPNFNNQIYSSNNPMPNIKNKETTLPNKNQNFTFSEQVNI